MNNKSEFNAFDESLFQETDSVAFGERIVGKLGMSGTVTLQLVIGTLLAFWYYGTSTEFALAILVLAATALAVMFGVVRSVANEFGEKAYKPVDAFIEHRHFMGMVFGAVVCTVARRISRIVRKG